MAGDRPSVISKESLVPLGLLFSFVLVVLSVYAYLDERFDRIETQLAATKARVESGTMDRWTAADMRLWVALLQGRNPSIDVPSPVAGGPPTSEND